MPILRADISVRSLGEKMRGHDFYRNFLEVVFGVFIAKMQKGAFGEQLAGLDDAYGVAKFFDFGHDVSGEEHRFAVVTAFADEGRDCARGHDIEAESRFIEDHYRRIVDQSASDGSFL